METEYLFAPANIWFTADTHYNGGSGTVMPLRNPNGIMSLCNQLGYVELNEDRYGLKKDASFKI